MVFDSCSSTAERSTVNRITSELRFAEVIDNVGNGDGLFRLTISCLIDGYAEAVTRLPGVFYIWVLLNGADDGFAAEADTGGFSIPPKEFPTIRSTPPMEEAVRTKKRRNTPGRNRAFMVNPLIVERIIGRIQNVSKCRSSQAIGLPLPLREGS